MTALRFQTGDGGASDIPGLPSGQREGKRHDGEEGEHEKGHNLPAGLLLPVEGDARVPTLVQVPMLGGGRGRVLEVATALGANDLTGDLVCCFLHLGGGQGPLLLCRSAHKSHRHALSRAFFLQHEENRNLMSIEHVLSVLLCTFLAISPTSTP